MMRSAILLRLSTMIVTTAIFTAAAHAQYRHLTGDEVGKLIVGHTIALPYFPTIFEKDGHLGSPYGGVSKSTYKILPDGQVCFTGGQITASYKMGGSANLGKCIRIVQSAGNYVALLPDSDRDLFILNFRN